MTGRDGVGRREFVRLAGAASALTWGATGVAGTADTGRQSEVDGVPGYLGVYYNLSETHPDTEDDAENYTGTGGEPTTGLVREELPLRLTAAGREYYDAFDWYESGYRSRRRVDRSLDFGRDFFPLDEGVAGDPFHFAVHWRAELLAPEDDSYTFATVSDDESWVFVDGELVVDSGGLHGAERVDATADLSAGRHRVDVFYADRHTSDAVMRFLPDDRLTPRAPVGPVATLNTGFDEAAGEPIPHGEPDPDWMLTFDGRPDPAEETPHDAYVVPAAGEGVGDDWDRFEDSRWVSIAPDKSTVDLPEADTAFRYTTTFDLPGSAEAPLLRLRARGDDLVKSVELNGRALPVEGRGEFTGDPATGEYSDPSLFRAGENRLSVVVEDTAQVETGLDVAGEVLVERAGVRVEGADTTVFQGEAETVELDLVNATDGALTDLDVTAEVEVAGIEQVGRVPTLDPEDLTRDRPDVTVRRVEDVPDEVAAGSTGRFRVALDVPDGIVGRFPLNVTVDAAGSTVASDTVEVTVESPIEIEEGTILPLTGKRNIGQGVTLRNRGTEPVGGIELDAEVDAPDIEVTEIGDTPPSLGPEAIHEQQFTLEVAPDAAGTYGLQVTVTAEDGVEARGVGTLEVVETVQVGVDLPTDGSALEPGEEVIRFTFDVTANQFRDVSDVRIEPAFSELPGEWSLAVDDRDPRTISAADGDGGEWSLSDGNPVWTKASMATGETQQPSLRIAVPEGIRTDRYAFPTTAQGGVDIDPEQELVNTVRTELNVVERFVGLFVSTPDEELQADEPFTVSVYVRFEDAPVEDPRVVIPTPPGFTAEASESTAPRGEFVETSREQVSGVWTVDGTVEPGERYELEFGLRTPSLDEIERFQETYRLTATASGTVPSRDRSVEQSASGQVYIGGFDLLAANKLSLAERIDRYTVNDVAESAAVRTLLGDPNGGGLRGALDDGEITTAAAERAIERHWSGESVGARLLETMGPAPRGGDTVYGTPAYNVARSTAQPIVLSLGSLLVEIAVLSAAMAGLGYAAALGIGTAIRGGISTIREGARQLGRRYLGDAYESSVKAGGTAKDVARARTEGEVTDGDGMLDLLADQYASVVTDVQNTFVDNLETDAAFYGRNQRGASLNTQLTRLNDGLGVDAVRSGLPGDQRTALAAANAGVNKLDFLGGTTAELIDTFDGPDLGAIMDAASRIWTNFQRGNVWNFFASIGSFVTETVLTVYNTLTGGLLGSLLGIEGIEKGLLVTRETTAATVGGRQPDFGSLPDDLI